MSDARKSRRRLLLLDAMELGVDESRVSASRGQQYMRDAVYGGRY